MIFYYLLSPWLVALGANLTLKVTLSQLAFGLRDIVWQWWQTDQCDWFAIIKTRGAIVSRFQLGVYFQLWTEKGDCADARRGEEGTNRPPLQSCCKYITTTTFEGETRNLLQHFGEDQKKMSFKVAGARAVEPLQFLQMNGSSWGLVYKYHPNSGVSRQIYENHIRNSI